MNIVVYDHVNSTCMNMNAYDRCVNIESELQKDFIKKDCYDTLFQKFNTREKHSQSQAKDTVILKLKEKLHSLSGDMNERKVKRELEKIETLKIELENRVTKLVAKNEHLKQTYKQLYDSIKPLRVNLLSSASGSKSQDNTKNKIQRTPRKAKKNKLEDHLRTVRPILNKKSVVDTKATSSVINSMSNVNSDLKCASCKGCLFFDNHDACVVAYINSVNASMKSKFVKKPVNRIIWQPIGKMFTTVGHIWKPTGQTFTLVGNVRPLTRLATTTIVPLREAIPIASNTDKPVITLVVQIVLWYLDSGCSKHMTRDRSQLINFVRKFLGTVKFGKDHVAKIMGYDDYQIGNVTISRVYYVEGLG
uniref:Integrase, catalytic region, zinc finger, CCHC-type, peptidase aspartic, catalytic n=1 Tax=Tanacetum cinerariifolium TaxID=118510 RepID=A0A6L2P512_TANCI|nr:integrase, catalytic region, zinc finger, CCHC-type, peptidase aspartic, catalytic [Tanacetum cinerariifolium]